jgi:DNA replication and repair protein RecF
MHLKHLSLTHFRNYVRLELDLPTGLTIVQGQNAQGKSNLLEAVVYLATSKSLRAGSDVELVNWLVREEPYPFARLAAEVVRGEKTEHIDITLMPGKGNGRYRKQVRINGVNKRSMDLVGMMRTVIFRPEDVDLVSGSPGQRRRYLDIALCQIEPAYCRALSHYQKVLAQRNALLRNLAEQRAANVREQLRYWDEKLVESGGYVVARRQWFINELEKDAALVHLDLSGGVERLHLRYLPSFDPGQQPANAHAPYPSTQVLRERGVSYADLTPEQARASFLAHLSAGRSRDLAAGMTLIGPHRDDLGFYLGERNLRAYGSRGQQRTAALASKLAEVSIMARVSGESPILLLDDVMSELDATRRAMLLEVIPTVKQAIVTTTDWDYFTLKLLEHAYRLQVHEGRLQTTDDFSK